jgi:hypothetical protein
MMDIDNFDSQPMQIVQEQTSNQDEEVFDLDDLDDDNMFAKPAVKKEESKTQAKENILRKVRKYDLSITYDFYTCTPRLWLTGYAENG